MGDESVDASGNDGFGGSAARQPVPELPRNVEPFYLSLDGGGRHLITDLIRSRRINLMVEIGCYVCGSARQWLDAHDQLIVVGVDGWGGNWSLSVRNLAAAGNSMLDVLDDPEQTAQLIQRYGNYWVALNNIRDLRSRFIPVRQRSPEAFRYLPTENSPTAHLHRCR